MSTFSPDYFKEHYLKAKQDSILIPDDQTIEFIQNALLNLRREEPCQYLTFTFYDILSQAVTGSTYGEGIHPLSLIRMSDEGKDNITNLLLRLGFHYDQTLIESSDFYGRVWTDKAILEGGKD